MLQMDLDAKLVSAEVPTSIPAIPIKELTEPAAILSAARIQTRFQHPTIKLEVTTSSGEHYITFLPSRFISILTDADLQKITDSKQYVVQCTGMGTRSPHVLIFKKL